MHSRASTCCFQEAAFNLVLLSSQPVLLTDYHADATGKTLSIAALAQQLAAASNILLAESNCSFDTNTATWLPRFYALVPSQASHLLAYRCATVMCVGHLASCAGVRCKPGCAWAPYRHCQMQCVQFLQIHC